MKFQRNLNIYGIDEPLLFIVKRNDSEILHLARLFKEFFHFSGGSCSLSKRKRNSRVFSQIDNEIRIKWSHASGLECWIISGLSKKIYLLLPK